jgi:hypothetical protein
MVAKLYPKEKSKSTATFSRHWGSVAIGFDIINCVWIKEWLGDSPERNQANPLRPAFCYNAANLREALGSSIAQRRQDLLPG